MCSAHQHTHTRTQIHEKSNEFLSANRSRMSALLHLIPFLLLPRFVFIATSLRDYRHVNSFAHPIYTHRCICIYIADMHKRKGLCWNLFSQQIRMQITEREREWQRWPRDEMRWAWQRDNMACKWFKYWQGIPLIYICMHLHSHMCIKNTLKLV